MHLKAACVACPPPPSMLNSNVLPAAGDLHAVARTPPLQYRQLVMCAGIPGIAIFPSEGPEGLTVPCQVYEGHQPLSYSAPSYLYRRKRPCLL